MAQGKPTRTRHGGQGNRSRCHECNHLRGRRGLGKLVVSTGSFKKASCNHECHGA
jgi:hypothetical protein